MRNYKTGICSGCEKEALIVHKSKRLCIKCLNRTKTRKRVDNHKRRVEEGKEIDPNKLSVFYQSYWNRYPLRFCVECGVELKKFYRWHIHHLIPKKKWRDYDVDIVFSDSNCVFVCLECHSKAETRLETTQRIKELTEEKQKEFEPHKRSFQRRTNFLGESERGSYKGDETT